jgi:hypothetical protein
MDSRNWKAFLIQCIVSIASTLQYLSTMVSIFMRWKGEQNPCSANYCTCVLVFKLCVIALSLRVLKVI